MDKFGRIEKASPLRPRTLPDGKITWLERGSWPCSEDRPKVPSWTTRGRFALNVDNGLRADASVPPDPIPNAGFFHNEADCRDGVLWATLPQATTVSASAVPWALAYVPCRHAGETVKGDG